MIYLPYNSSVIRILFIISIINVVHSERIYLTLSAKGIEFVFRIVSKDIGELNPTDNRMKY